MDEKQLLQMALNEIKTLRNHNEQMSIKLSAYEEVLSAVNEHSPKKILGGSMMSPDIAYEIRNYLDCKKED